MSDIKIDRFSVTIPEGSSSWKLEKALEPITAEMNQSPLMIDRSIWKRNLDRLQGELTALTEKCRMITGNRGFLAHSRNDCEEEFVNRRGYDARTTKKGGVSIDQEVLQSWANKGDELAPIVIQARELQAKVSQLEAWAKYVADGKVQAQWNQLGTPHGRYSCEEPNLQSRVLEIRETVVSRPGYSFLSLDLGQAEYVVWASLSKDKLLSSAFIEGVDFHTRMMNEISAVVGDVTLRMNEKDPRKAGKTMNFALLYLMQDHVFASRLGISTADTKKLIKAYRDRAPDAVNYIETILSEAVRTGCVSTKFGRTRLMPGMKSHNRYELHSARKTAWHHHNAGTAAEILKIKQVQSWKEIRKTWNADDVRMVIQFHDEVIFEVRDELLEQIKEVALAVFKKDLPSFLPFKIDCRTGKNWLAISK